VTLTPTATLTPIPSATVAALAPTPAATAPAVVLLSTQVVVDNTPFPVITPTLLPEAFVFGQSVRGTPLTAHRFGTGTRYVLLVGGIHTGYEVNTVALMREMLLHFGANSAEIPPNVGLLIVPVLNVDGLNYIQIRGRFNENEVDLNRNWGCGWSAQAFFRETPVKAGNAPFSEPESTALGALIQQQRPAAVLFFHAAARGVFPGNCEGNISNELAQVYSSASGYPFQEIFAGYGVTGSASGWVDSQGIPAADVELATADDTELIRNLNGVRAVLQWAAER
jgi:hypothetical protein